jgi:hypothetical protein
LIDFGDFGDFEKICTKKLSPKTIPPKTYKKTLIMPETKYIIGVASIVRTKPIISMEQMEFNKVSNIMDKCNAKIIKK